MRRYANLIETGLSDRTGFSIHRVSLASEATREWLPAKAQTLAHHAGIYRRSGQLARRREFDIYHVVDGSHGYLLKPLTQQATVVTVHDIIPKLQSEGRFAGQGLGRASRLVVDQALSGIRYASRVIVDSESTGRDLRDHGMTCDLPVIYPPLEPGFAGPTSLTTQRDPFPFVLHIGNNGFYKNRKGVLEIFAKMAADVPHHLKMAGPPPTREHLEFIEQTRLTDRVHWVHHPTDAEVKELYRTASLLLFPSIYEGFGWPPIEAMASGCPVVCSDSGSLAEVVGDAAMVSRHVDIGQMANDAMVLLRDASRREKLIGAGYQNVKRFDLASFGDQLIDVYETLR